MGYYNYAYRRDTTLRVPRYSTMIGYCKIYTYTQHLLLMYCIILYWNISVMYDTVKLCPELTSCNHFMPSLSFNSIL